MQDRQITPYTDEQGTAKESKNLVSDRRQLKPMPITTAISAAWRNAVNTISKRILSPRASRAHPNAVMSDL